MFGMRDFFHSRLDGLPPFFEGGSVLRRTVIGLQTGESKAR
jgi:hypothetical protein